MRIIFLEEIVSIVNRLLKAKNEYFIASYDRLGCAIVVIILVLEESSTCTTHTISYCEVYFNSQYFMSILSPVIMECAIIIMVQY